MYDSSDRVGGDFRATLVVVIRLPLGFRLVQGENMVRHSLLTLLLAAAIAPRVRRELREGVGKQIEGHFKGTRVTVMVPRFYAGEFKRDLTARVDFVNWHHYHENLPVEAGKAVLDQVDDRTYATGPALGGPPGLGSNTFPVTKGEAMSVSNVLFSCSRGLCTLVLLLDTTKLSKAAGLDPRKESRGDAMLESAGLGCAFLFHFSRATIDDAKAEDIVVSTVRKYLLPPAEAEKLLRQEQDISIDIGATEEEVIAKLGEPLKTVRVGSQKTLKYADMTVILKDGKVADVKVE
jgi:hypothetical protein